MIDILYHALEGSPEKTDFTAKTERDLRVRWLLEDFTDGNKPQGAPWEVDPAQSTSQKIVLKRSTKPNARLPLYLKEVHLVIEPKGSEVARRLQLPSADTTRLDFAPTLTDPSTFKTLQDNPQIQVHTMPGLNLFYLGFYWERRASDPIRKFVRQAINKNKQKYAAIGMGAADPAESPIPPCMDGHDPNDQEDRFDPAVADSLLKEIKIDSTLTLLHNSGNSYIKDLAATIRADISAVSHGTLSVQLQGYPTWGDLVAAVRARQGDMFIYSWHQRGRHSNDPYDFLIALFHTRNIGATNLTQYSNKTVDDSLSGPTPDHRKATGQIHTDVPMIYLSHWKRKAAYNRRVSGLNLNFGALPEDKLVGVSIP